MQGGGGTISGTSTRREEIAQRQQEIFLNTLIGALLQTGDHRGSELGAQQCRRTIAHSGSISECRGTSLTNGQSKISIRDSLDQPCKGRGRDLQRAIIIAEVDQQPSSLNKKDRIRGLVRQKCIDGRHHIQPCQRQSCLLRECNVGQNGSRTLTEFKRLLRVNHGEECIQRSRLTEDVASLLGLYTSAKNLANMNKKVTF
mmetsp:Transcript_28333/g.71122  ORF Transcript_28333/g.71122 Transcript_28333/m.71122 type:complete len:200 (-) Transcript_28333:2068-2667(-)